MGPVTGANIVIKGTTNGTISDLDGKFTLENVPATQSCKFPISVIFHKKLQLTTSLLITLC